MKLTSMFPYFAAEAGSGAAKTNGFFPLMVALNGNHEGNIVSTTAAFRDSASVNTNGILWADDMNEPERLQEILRAATSAGKFRKKGEDRVNMNIEVLAPMLFSGEALMLSDQKALLERGILVHLRKPTERMSLHPDREGLTQWGDITNLMAKYPGEKSLSVLAGWFVQEALRVKGEYLAALQARLTITPGRRGEKYAIMCAGARLLDHLMGNEGAWDGAGPTARQVDAWADAEVRKETGVEDDNRITLKLIPWAIQQFGKVYHENPHTVRFPRSEDQIPPVLITEADEGTIEDTEVWVNTAYLAKAWDEYKNGRIDDRLETPASLAEQIRQIAVPTEEARPSKRIDGHKVVYRKLKPGYADLVVRRASSDLSE
jgi:hypothetical protein